jgi:predicted DNA-binding transcriptional regulator YafY
MRADRLISLIMLLQTRGRMTAQALAKVLEVSERTIHRDIEALSAAGIPVYTESGPGGGCSLLDGYRSNLTGLSEDEVRALLMLGIPGPLREVGASQALRAAMLKLLTTMPAIQREEEARVRQRIHLDWVGWAQVEQPLPHLHTLQQAVWQDRKIHIVFGSIFDTSIAQLVAPYGLVAKASNWYLVCNKDDQLRVVRVSRVLEAHIADECFQRPTDFDLARYWADWCLREEKSRPRYPVTLRVAPEFLPELPRYLGRVIGDSCTEVGPPDAEGWVQLVLPFEGLAQARARLLGLGRAVEVLEPEALRQSLVDFAEQIVSFYGRRTRHLAVTPEQQE